MKGLKGWRKIWRNTPAEIAYTTVTGKATAVKRGPETEYRRYDFSEVKDTPVATLH
jgi:hypothetical protein